MISFLSEKTKDMDAYMMLCDLQQETAKAGWFLKGD